jgi:hypothetical protein
VKTFDYEEYLDARGLEGDARHALKLDGKPADELSPKDREWLAAYKASHRHRLVDDVTDWDCWEEDLGIDVAGQEVVGLYKYLLELGRGNSSVAGGWWLRVGTDHDENDWPQGWRSQLVGLDAFLKALGGQSLAASGEMLGPFESELDAYRALVVRMLSTLVIVSRSALAAVPASALLRARQEAAYEAWLAERSVTPEPDDTDPAIDNPGEGR